MTDVLPPTGQTRDSPPTRWQPAEVLGRIEHAAYIGIGALLSLAAVLGLTGAVVLAWDGVVQWPHARGLVIIVDRLLFVLMIVEILNTVRTSIQSHRLACEPFLIVALIATIRRILVVTLEASDRSTAGDATVGSAPPFAHAMIELVVLGLLTLVLAIAIRFACRRGA